MKTKFKYYEYSLPSINKFDNVQAWTKIFAVLCSPYQVFWTPKTQVTQITIGPAILALIQIHYFRLLLHCIKTEQVMHMNLQYQFLDLAPSHSNGFI